MNTYQGEAHALATVARAYPKAKAGKLFKVIGFPQDNPPGIKILGALDYLRKFHWSWCLNG